MDSLNQGIVISLFGIGITFLALSSVIFLIKFLLFIFPSTSSRDATITSSGEDDELNSHVAAIAAAWWSVQENRKDSSLGKNLEKDHGSWWYKLENR